jgi:putative serine protease PepD
MPISRPAHPRFGAGARRALVTAVSVTLLAACGGDQKQSAAPNGNAAAPVTKASQADEVDLSALTPIRNAAKAVVTLKSTYPFGHSHGTGVVIDADRGLVLTSNHLVEGADSIELATGDGAATGASVLARAQCDDLALLAMDAPPAGTTALKPGNSSTLRPGQPILALSYPGEIEDTDRPGTPKLAYNQGAVTMINATATLSTLLGKQTSLVGTDLLLGPASSGGALVTPQGTMVGLVHNISGSKVPASDKNMTFATSADRLRKLYAQLTPGEQSAFRGWEYQHRCHAGMVKLGARIAEPDHDARAPRSDSGGHEKGH